MLPRPRTRACTRGGIDPGKPPPHNGVSHCPARSRSPTTRQAPGPAVPGLDSILWPPLVAAPRPSQSCCTSGWVPHSQGLPRSSGRFSPFSLTDTHSSPLSRPRRNFRSNPGNPAISLPEVARTALRNPEVCPGFPAKSCHVAHSWDHSLDATLSSTASDMTWDSQLLCQPSPPGGPESWRKSIPHTIL